MSQIYSISQIRQIEHAAIKSGLPAEALMQRAASAAFDLLVEHWPYCRHIIVCAGKGHNAGDAIALVDLALQHGWQVDFYLCADQYELPTPSLALLETLQDAGLPILSMQDFVAASGAIIIDALLGIGLKGQLSDALAQAVQAINDSALPVLSLDVPTGVDADTGGVIGSAVRAEVCLTFVGYKQGLMTGPALSYVGHLVCDRLGIPDNCYSGIQSTLHVLNDASVEACLPPRDPHSHKGDFGHVLVIGGDYGMGGAVRMAAEAAMRVGAGLVTVATRPEHVNIVSGSRPELMCHQVQDADDLKRLIARASVIALGPGLGTSAWAETLFDCVLQSSLPKVFDADALNILSEHPMSIQDLVLTPHAGEAARLLGQDIAKIEADRIAAIRSLHERYGGEIVLKGAGTLIYSEEQGISLSTAGNPGMATGGSGDVLTGMIAGLIAQGLSPASAARVGVHTHARAADLAAEQGGERGLLATDILSEIRSVVNPRK